MKRQDKVIGIFLVCLVVGFSAVIVLREYQHQVEINEILTFNDGSGWGATITMSVYRDNVLISAESHTNVITNAFRSAIRAHIASATTTLWTYIAIGTGTGGDATSTTLVTEYKRAQGVYAPVGSYNFTLSFTWLPGNFTGQTITEYGLFNDPTLDTGVMFNYCDDYSRGPLTAVDTFEVVINAQMGS